MFTGISENNSFQTNVSFYRIFKKLPKCFWRDCTTLCSYQQCMKDPVSWHSCQYLALSLFFTCFCDRSICEPMDCSTPSFPVLHHHPEFAQTQVHWVDDAIQPSHPLLSPSPPALNLSQYQGLFQCINFTSGGQSIEASASALVLPMNIQDWFPLGLTGLISL